jgi:hypothetical protein
MKESEKNENVIEEPVAEQVIVENVIEEPIVEPIVEEKPQEEVMESINEGTPMDELAEAKTEIIVEESPEVIELNNLKKQYSKLEKQIEKLNSELELERLEKKNLKIDYLMSEHNVKEKDILKLMIEKEISTNKDVDLEKFIKETKKIKDFLFNNRLAIVSPDDRKVVVPKQSAKDKADRYAQIIGRK